MALLAHMFWYLVGLFGLSVGAHVASRGHPTTLVSSILTGIPAALSGIEKFTGALSKIGELLKGGKSKDGGKQEGHDGTGGGLPIGPLPPPPPWIFPPPGTYPPGTFINAVWPYPPNATYVVMQQHQLQFVDAYGNVAWVPVGPRELRQQAS